MNITNKTIDLPKSTVTFELDNVKLKYLSAIRRTIIADIPSYAVDNDDIKIIKNTSRNNNDEIITRIGMLPFDSQFAFSVNITNNGMEPIDITTSDFSLHSIYSDEFLTYISDSKKRSITYINECREKVVGSSYTSKKSNSKSNSNNDTDENVSDKKSTTSPNVYDSCGVIGRVMEYRDKSVESNKKRYLYPDIHIVSLGVGETIDLYGIASSGTPRTHVKWQTFNMFFRMCKEYPTMVLNWDEHIDRLVSIVSSISTEEEYTTHKRLVDKLMYKTSSYSEFKKTPFTPETVKTLKDEMKGIIEQTCSSVYKGDVNSHASHTRCIKCLERITHLLELKQGDLYSPKKTDVYKVTIRSNNGITGIYQMWDDAKDIFVSRCRQLMSNMDIIISSVAKHQSIHDGYTVLLDGCTYTFGEVLSYELVSEPKLSMSSYNHKHPTHSYIEFVLVLTEKTHDPKMVIKNIMNDALNRSIKSTLSISSIPK
jgi:DNA-directed RNA polymerase subunit L/DNA-directed RNA polymerase alpha subunit